MRFVLFGFPVHVRPVFWVVGLMLAQPRSFALTELGHVAMWLAIVFVSVLVHELGHAFAMRAVGRTPSIELWGMGGLTHWGAGPRVSGWRNAAVSIAGPLAGFVLAVPFVVAWAVGVAPEGSLGDEAIAMVLWANVGWGVLNLLPILPLDGGRVMEVAVVGALGAHGPRVARLGSIAVAAVAAVAALSYGMEWAAFLALLCGMQSFRELGAPAGDATIAARAAPRPELEREVDDAWDAIRSGRAVEAIETSEAKLATLPDARESAGLRARLLEMIAWGWLEEGEDGRALATRERMPAGFAPSALLEARLVLAEGRVDEGFRALEQAYAEAPGDLPAMVLAAALVDHDYPERAVAVLRGASAASVTTRGHLVISAALFYAEHFAYALEASELAWSRFREPTHAYNAACSLARLGRIDEGLDRLAQALRAGFADRGQLDEDPDLDALRGHPRFAEVTARR